MLTSFISLGVRQNGRKLTPGWCLLVLALSLTVSSAASGAEALKVLFLGDNGHHVPAQRFAQLEPVMAKRGIELTYTDQMTDLRPDKLNAYDALVLYANIDNIAPDQSKALLDYVAEGHGFVPLHCATFCFRNDPEIVALMGAQFRRHGTGVFRTEQSQPEHPLMKGFGGFESWDETYVHHLHNEKDRTVLEYRVDQEGREPWTWVRNHGKGRVFYTAWGHDHRTWSNPGFQNLVERGIRWAANRDPAEAGDYLAEQVFPVLPMTELRKDVAPFEYEEVGAKIPNYTPGQQWGTQGQPLTKMQRPLPAEESIKHYVTPQGFHLEQFIADPKLNAKPICMAWDERGRLWIGQTFDYPNELQPPGKGRDQISICEDTDGDWKADKVTVFAKGLSIPTSIAFHRGGVIVQDGVETLYLKDTDGDDVADQREVLITGWDMGDTHGGVSNFQYGLDNWIWGMQGYNDSNPVAKGQRQPSFRMGFFRFRPDGSQVEFIRSTNNNTWGLGISEEGIIFGSTANRNPSVYMPIPNRYYEKVRGWAPSLVLGTIADTYLFKAITSKVRQVDQHGGYTAGAGHALYTARAYPQSFWNRTAFVAEPTGHLVGTFVLKRDGSDFHSTSPINLVAADDEWAAPIMAEVGPDGSVWVLDWYNYIVQHNPTPIGFQTGKGNAYESDLRDKLHGRIYRVVNDSAPPEATRSLNLAKATPAELVAALRHPTMLWRRHAQRLLVERGETDVVPELLALVADPSVDAIGLNVGAIHALWTLHGLGALQDPASPAVKGVVAALKHPSAGVRRNAVQVLPAHATSVEQILAADLAHDTDAQVRLATLLALADQPASPAIGKLLVELLRDPTVTGDVWLPDALTSVAAVNASSFLIEAVADQQRRPQEKLTATAGVIAGHLARSNPSADELTSLLQSMARQQSAVSGAIIDGISSGWNADQKFQITEPLEASLAELVKVASPETQGKLVKLARKWGSHRLDEYAQQIADSLLKQVSDDNGSVEQRSDSARQLVEFAGDDPRVTEGLLELITPSTAPELAVALIRACEAARHDQAGEQLISRLEQLTPELRTAALTVLLKRPAMTRSLLAAVEAKKLSIEDLSLDQRQALAVHPDAEIRQLAEKVLAASASLPSADRKAVLEEWLPVAGRTGNVAAGHEVFRQQCSKCHMYRGEGNRIGPELTGMAVHPKDELLTNILDPSRSVEGNFRVYTIVTHEGRVLTGMLAAESRTAVELFDAEGKKQSLLREDVDELVRSNKSLMPEGFEKLISQQQMTDLLEFLTQRGRYVPLDLSKVATVSSARGMFFSPESTIERLEFPDWNTKMFHDIPFMLTDPQGGRRSNVVLLYGPQGDVAPRMPRQVEIPCRTEAVAIHMLSGISGWGFPGGEEGSTSMIVRVNYQDGQTEDHELKNGEHFADYIRRVDVPKSEFAFNLKGHQLRYLSIKPARRDPIKSLQLIKGDDGSAPIVMAITVETSQTEAAH
ncbi:MAG: PVC-type heme-binding CxxCH protein [Pirellulales bacterium]